MARDLDLPPAFTAVTLRELGDAFGRAQQIAFDSGAGTLVWVRRFDSVELAIVLEPEEPLSTGRRAVYAVMNAAADALAAYCPPEKPIAFIWPDAVLLDGGLVGGTRLAWPAGSCETEPADWIVVGLTLRLALPIVRRERGEAGHPLDVVSRHATSLEIEGFEMLDAATLVGAVARHLMVQVDRWREDGFAAVARDFLGRLPPAPLLHRRIDDTGDLLIEPQLRGKGRTAERRSLLAALATPQWLDPETGDPWL